ncbi:MAG: 4-phosphopantetheinyl transferase family protein [Acidimicrobiia bacterium]|nr:4-phosphopantetheinyl transferase family protein [Acidimicrobiia bacterium]
MSRSDDVVGEECSAGLGVTLRVRRAATPMTEGQLTGGERRQWHALATGPRKSDWLLGRTALKALLSEAADTSTLSFPHPRLSLTHAGGVAVAVAAGLGIGGDPVVVAGTGVDHEPWRTVDARMARFFLHAREQSTSLGLLRAWTVKEALYKAVPANLGLTLLDIALDDPDAPNGGASGPRGERLRYTVIDTAAGPLAAAVCLEDCRVTV